MNEVFILEQELLFKTSVYEITSISIEHNYDVNSNSCSGEFIISGDYRLHEVSLNKENFSFRIPFNNEVRSNVNLDSVEVEITDFTYQFNDDVIQVKIEYQVRDEQNLIEFASDDELDNFLENHEVEVVDLSQDDREGAAKVSSEPMPEPAIIPEVKVEEPVVIHEAELQEDPKTMAAEPAEMTEAREVILDQQSMINSINSEESFITYHVHTVVTGDTLESIANTYNANPHDLKSLNGFEELTLGMKLIIPDETD